MCVWAFPLAAWNFSSKKFITVFGLTFTPHKSNFFLLNLIGPSKKKLKLWKLRKIENSMDKWSASPLAHRYMWEGKDFEQNIWD